MNDLISFYNQGPTYTNDSWQTYPPIENYDGNHFDFLSDSTQNMHSEYNEMLPLFNESTFSSKKLELNPFDKSFNNYLGDHVSLNTLKPRIDLRLPKSKVIEKKAAPKSKKKSGVLRKTTILNKQQEVDQLNLDNLELTRAIDNLKQERMDLMMILACHTDCSLLPNQLPQSIQAPAYQNSQL